MRTSKRMVRAAIAGVAVLPLVALAACTSSGDDGGTPEEGVTITYAVQGFAHEAIAPIVQEFTDETGITVELVDGPASGQDLLTQLVPAFTSGTTPYDVIDADDPAVAALIAGGWLEPLGDEITADYLADLSEGMLDSHEQWNVVDGESYRLYHNYELGYYWVNQETLDAYGVPVPTTWEELESAGETLKQQGSTSSPTPRPSRG